MSRFVRRHKKLGSSGEHMKMKSTNDDSLSAGVPAREHAIGILQLLHLADQAIRVYFIDSPCEGILSSCARQMRAVYALSESDYVSDACWKEPSFEALLRMIEYVRVEMCTTFSDKAAGERLAACITQLTTNRQSPRDETQKLTPARRH
jgi:hypothetical protein